MAYRIDVHRPLRDEIRRIGRTRIRQALTAVGKANKTANQGSYSAELAAPVFVMRRRCKQVRALTRLSGSDDTAAGQIDRRARRAAAAVAPIRDFEAETAARRTLTTLTNGAELEVPEPLPPEDIEERLARARSELHKAQDLVEQWKPSETFAAMTPGLKSTYRQGRNQLGSLRDLDVLGIHSVADAHEWREHAKYLRYQMRLLRDVAPPHISLLISELDQINSLLGEDRDLWLVSRHVPPGPLAATLDVRHAALQSTAIDVGTMIYAEHPKAFANRIATYWNVASGHAAAGHRHQGRAAKLKE